jgi:hypothetical protein
MAKTFAMAKSPVTGLNVFQIDGEFVDKGEFVGTLTAQTLTGFGASWLLGKALGIGFWRGVALVWGANAIRTLPDLRVKNPNNS